MNKRILAVGVCLLAAAGLSTRQASALGPVDVEVGAMYWDADTEIDTEFGSGSESASAPGLYGDVWLKNSIGFGVSRYEASPDGFDADSEYTSVDAKYRFLNATRNNFVAVGVGAEQVAFVDDSTIAPRIIVEGRASVKMVYFFGKGAYLPTVGDMTIAGAPIKGKTGMELEAGVGFKPLPLMSIQASYKANAIELEDEFLGDVTIDNSGPMLGLVFTF